MKVLPLRGLVPALALALASFASLAGCSSDDSNAPLPVYEAGVAAPFDASLPSLDAGKDAPVAADAHPDTSVAADATPPASDAATDASQTAEAGDAASE
jgi:hypothetical protein